MFVAGGGQAGWGEKREDQQGDILEGVQYACLLVCLSVCLSVAMSALCDPNKFRVSGALCTP